MNLHPLFLGLDSLYLVVEYPHADVYAHWAGYIADGHAPQLFDGVVVDDVVIRRGGLGYKLSIWQGDARLFITDQVSDALTHSMMQGMGMMLQLGPMWLVKHANFADANALQQAVYRQLEAFRVSYPQQYAIRLNRLDVALDVQGAPVSDFSMNDWRDGWVGYATKKDFHISAKTGALSGLSIGTSSGAVRFKAYNKLEQCIQEGDFLFWFSVWQANIVAEFEHVTRFEWSTKPYQAKFADLRYLSDYSFDRLKELAHYVTSKWGRLCIPNLTDENTSRWGLHPLWIAIQRTLDSLWDVQASGYAKRDYHWLPDLNEAYLNAVSGWLAGFMARVGLDSGLEAPAPIHHALRYLHQQGFTFDDKARDKWERFTRLIGGRDI